MSSTTTPSQLITAAEIKYLKKILAAHIVKLEDATLFDEDLQKKNVEFSKQILKKLDGLAEIKDKAFHLQLPDALDGSIIIDEINLLVRGASVGRISLK